MDIDIVDNIPVKKSNIFGQVLLGTFGAAAISITAISLPFIFPAFRTTCLPYVPATPQAVANIFNLVSKHRPNCSSLIDLGSGDGRIVMEAAHRGIVSVGVELNPWLVAYSKFKALLLKNKSLFYCSDLWKFNLRPFDVIVIFGVEQMMPQLKQHIIQQRITYQNFTDLKPDLINKFWPYSRTVKLNKLHYNIKKKNMSISNQVAGMSMEDIDERLTNNNALQTSSQIDLLIDKHKSLDASHTNEAGDNEVEENLLIICSRFRFADCEPVDRIGSGIDTAWAYNLQNILHNCK